MNVVVVLAAALLPFLLLPRGCVGAESQNQPVHGVRQGRKKSLVSSHVGLCEALQYPCLIGTVLPHPTDCRLYLQCVFPGVGQVGVSNNWIVRSCSQGTMFDRHQLYCVLPSGVECAERCENNGTIPGLSDKEGTQDLKVKEIPPTKPQEKKAQGNDPLPGDERQAERPSIPLSETLYLPEQLELPPQDYNTLSNIPRTAQRGRAAQGEEQHSGYRPESKYPLFRSTDHSLESRGPRGALGQDKGGHHPPHRPSDHAHGARGGLGERVEPRKGRFPEYRPTDYQTDDHKGAWKGGQYPQGYIPRTEGHPQNTNPEALIDRHKSGGIFSEHRIIGDSHGNPPEAMGGGNQPRRFNTDMFKPRASRDAQQRPTYGSFSNGHQGAPPRDDSSPHGQQGAAQSTKVRGEDAKQAPENQGGSPEQFWWEALNLLYSQEAKERGDTGAGGDGLGDNRGPGQTQDGAKSRSWRRRKDVPATNWNKREDSLPSRNMNRKQPTARNLEPPRDRVDPAFRNLNRENPPMGNSNRWEGQAAPGGSNRESPPMRTWDRVDPPWRTREISPVFPAQTPRPHLQQQSQFPVRLAIPTPQPIPEPSTLSTGRPQGGATTVGSSGRDVGRSSRFPIGYRSKTRAVTKSAHPEKTEYHQRKAATTRGVFGSHVTMPEATTEAPSTIMPWGMFYKLLRKYALGSDTSPGSGIGAPRTGQSPLGPTTPATLNQQEKEGPVAGISEGGDADSPGRVTSPRTPYLGAKMGRNYRLGYSSSEYADGRSKDGQLSQRHGADRETGPQQGSSHSRNTHPTQGHWAEPDQPASSRRPAGTRAKVTGFSPIETQRTVDTVALPKPRGIDPRNIAGKSSLPGVPRPAVSGWTNPSKAQSASSQEQSSEYSIEEPPGGGAGTSAELLLRSIEGMFPDLDLSDLDPAELERFLNRQITSAELVDTDTFETPTTDTTSTSERVTTTTRRHTTAAVTIATTHPAATLALPRAKLQKPTQATTKPSTKSASETSSEKSPEQPNASSEQPKSSSEQPKSVSEQLRTVRIPLSSISKQLLEQQFTDPSSQSSAAEAASRVRTLYRYLQRRLRLQGYRPVLKIAELPVTASTTTTTTTTAAAAAAAVTDGTIPERKVPRSEGSLTGFSEQRLNKMKEESHKLTPPPPTTINAPESTTTTTTTQRTPTKATSRPTTTLADTTEKSENTQSERKYTGPTEEIIEIERYKKEPWHRESKATPTHGIEEGSLKQSEVEDSFGKGTPKASMTTEGINAESANNHLTTHPTTDINPSTRPSIGYDTDSVRKSSEFFEATPEEDVPYERDGTEAKDPRDKDVFHLPQTTISHTPNTQRVAVQYGHVAMPTVHEGDSRSLEMVYSVSEEESGGNSHQYSNQNSRRDGDSSPTTKAPSGNPYQTARHIPEGDSLPGRDSAAERDSPGERNSPAGRNFPAGRDSPAERDSPSERNFPAERDSQPDGDSPITTTEAPPGVDSLRPLTIPGAMPPPGGWRKRVEHKMLLDSMEGMREDLGEGLDEGLGEGMRQGVRDRMRDSHLFEHIHPEVAPAYEPIDGVDYTPDSVQKKATPTVTATTTATATDTATDTATATATDTATDTATATATDTATATGADTDTTTTGNDRLGGGGGTKGGYPSSVLPDTGYTSTLPITTPTTAHILTMDFGTYHSHADRPRENTGTAGQSNVRGRPSPSSGHTAMSPTNPPHTDPVTQHTENKLTSGFADRNRELTKPVGSPEMRVTHPISSTTLAYDTTSTMMGKDPLAVPTAHKETTQPAPITKQAVNKTLNVLHVDTHPQGNVRRTSVEGLTTDRPAGTTTTVTMKAEGVSVGLIVGISFVILLLIAIAMLPLICCVIYKKDQKRMNDQYMDRTDITTLASYGTNDRNYTSTTTLASVGSTRPLIRTPSWINKMMLFKKLNRKSVSDHCLVNMYHERQHPSTEDLYGSHGNQSCHLATKYASLSTERAASRKKRKSRESSSRMDDVISDFADESVFYLKRPKVKTKQFTPSVV